ncbi:MAG: hypothetical protein WCJ37_11440 [Syntrophus sp. (in: bacteria)]
MKYDDKKTYTNNDNTDETPESSNTPSVLEVLGPDWKEYFHKPETINRIVQEALKEKYLRIPYRYASSQRKKVGPLDYKMTHDFVDISSVTQLGENRQRVIALFRDIRSGLIEKWSVDVTSTAILWEQIRDALYCPDEDCAGRVIMVFEDSSDLPDSDPVIEVENNALRYLRDDTIRIEDKIYYFHATIEKSGGEKSNIQFSCPGSPQNLGANRRKKNPPLSVFKETTWKWYRAAIDSIVNTSYVSKLIANSCFHDGNIPFIVSSRWTEKGLFMWLFNLYDRPEVFWLIKDKKDEIARRYPGCKIKVKMKEGLTYYIEIQFNKESVVGFIELSATEKVIRALKICEQEFELIRHIEEIFKDYIPVTD